MWSFWWSAFRRFFAASFPRTIRVEELTSMIPFFVAVIAGALLWAGQSDSTDTWGLPDGWRQRILVVCFVGGLLVSVLRSVYEEHRFRSNDALSIRDAAWLSLLQTEERRVQQAQREIKRYAAKAQSIADTDPRIKVTADKAREFCNGSDEMIQRLLADGKLDEFHAISDVALSTADLDKMHTDTRKRLIWNRAAALIQIANSLDATELRPSIPCTPSDRPR